MQHHHKFIICGAILTVGIAMLIAGSIMLGIGVHKSKQKNTCPSITAKPVLTTTPSPQQIDRDAIRKRIRDGMNSDNIKRNLRNFTVNPHQAGTANNKQVADSIKDLWRDAGLEDVHEISYTVLLTYPDENNPNRLTISTKTGDVVYKTNGTSPVYFLDEQGAPGAGIQWLAYSPNGTAKGDVVYCHMGSASDFQQLKDNGIDLTGKLALIRYGGPFRGDKVKLAEKAGAVGAILFSDPREAAKMGGDDKDTYPNTIYMPPDGVQRGTVYTGDGDPLSPLYPSKPNLWRGMTMEEAMAAGGDLPTIPCLPISYSAAYEILKRMNPPAAPNNWQGGLNVTYNYGPGMVDGMTLSIDVHAHFENRTIQNVVGYIYGYEEPDKYIILGNHYDAWVYGAMDPNAGTAALAEVARSIGQTVQQTEWRPARTIMFANWDSEEFGLIGSTEFVEDFGPILMKRAVVYVNMDCLKGNLTLYVQASPSLNQVTIDSAKNIPNPNQDEVTAGRKTVYDTWVNNFPAGDHNGLPYISYPKGGSDHKTFLTYLGIPVINFYFLQSNDSFTYPLYHTLYETKFAIENLMDTDNYATHKAICQYWAEMALNFADTPTIPFRLSDLTNQIQNVYIPQLNKDIVAKNMSQYTADGLQQLKYMTNTGNILNEQAEEFDKASFSFDDDALVRIRRNDRLANFQNCFVNPRGAPGDPTARHVLFSTSKTDSYAGTVMQQVYAILDQMTPSTNPASLAQLSRELANQISIVHYSLQCAASAINSFI